MGAGKFFLKRGGLKNSMGPGKFSLKGGAFSKRGGPPKKGGAGHPTGTMSKQPEQILLAVWKLPGWLLHTFFYRQLDF